MVLPNLPCPKVINECAILFWLSHTHAHTQAALILIHTQACQLIYFHLRSEVWKSGRVTKVQTGRVLERSSSGSSLSFFSHFSSSPICFTASPLIFLSEKKILSATTKVLLVTRLKLAVGVQVPYTSLRMRICASNHSSRFALLTSLYK